MFRSPLQLVAIFGCLVVTSSAADPKADPDVDGVPLSRWIELYQSTDLKVRNAATAVINNLGPRAAPAVPTLIKLLAEGDTSRASMTLAGIGAPAVPHLVPLLEDPRVPGVMAAVTLRRMGADAVPVIAASLSGSKGRPRELLIEILGEKGDRAHEAVSHLQPFLSSQDARLRLQAAIALSRIDSRKNPDTLPVLLGFVKQGEASDQKVAAEAIGRALEQSSKRATWQPADDETLRVVIDWMRGESVELRSRAFDTASRLALARPSIPAPSGPNDPRDPEQIRLLTDRHQRLKQQLLPHVAEGLKHPDRRTQLDAIETVGDFGAMAEPFVPTLLDRMREPNYMIRVLSALRSIGPSAQIAIEPVKALTGSDDSQVRSAAIAALKSISSDESPRPSPVGSVLARDLHSGYTGFKSKSNEYLLAAEAEQTVPRTQLRFHAKGDRSPNTFGTISVSVDGKNWHEAGHWTKTSCEAAAKSGDWHTLPLSAITANLRGRTLHVRFAYTMGSEQLNIDAVHWSKP